VGKNKANIHLRLHEANIVKKKIPDKPRVLFKIMTGELTEAYKSQIPGGLLQYTLITVQFWRKKRRDISEEIQQQCDCRLAYRFINRFIDIYRYVTKDLEVRPLTWKDFHSVRAGRALHYLGNEIVKGNGKLIMGVMFTEDFPIVMADDVLLNEEQHSNIIEWLYNDKKPEIVDLLLLNAEAYKMDQEFRLAVVEVGTALDVVVEMAALQAMKGQGFSQIDIEKLERLSTKQIVEEKLRTLIKPDIYKLKVWQDWDKIGRVLRNKVVHDGYEPTIDEVQFCLNTVKSLISDIRKAKLISKI